MAQVYLKAGDGKEPVAVEIRTLAADGATRFSVQTPGTSEEIDYVERGEARWLCIHGRVLPFRAVRQGDCVEVWLAGRSYRLGIESKQARRGAAGGGAASHADEIIAPMPGTILKIQRQAGETFAAHEPLIIMESMKMEMALSAPAPGRVAEVLCTAGELVPMGRVLLKLERLEPTDAA